MTDTTTVYAPKAPHPETLADPRNTIAAGGRHGRELVTYCRRNNVGGIYRMAGELWALWCPVTLEEFLQVLAAQRTVIADSGALQTWLDHVSGAADAPKQ